MAKNVENKLEEKAKKISSATTVHNRHLIINQASDGQIYNWIIAQRESKIAVFIASIFVKGSAIDGTLKNCDQGKLVYYVYPFLTRWNPSCRIASHTGQWLTGHQLSGRKPFAYHLMNKFSFHSEYRNVLPLLFVHMDETEIFFEKRPKSTVHPHSVRAISFIASVRSKRRLIARATVASDDTKVPLFLIFKCQPYGRVEKALHEYMSNTINAFYQQERFWSFSSIIRRFHLSQVSKF